MRLFLMAVLSLGLFAPTAHSQSIACERVSAFCTNLVDRQCQSRLGAGSLPETADATGCTQQLSSYRECLTLVTENCSTAAEAPTSSATQGRENQSGAQKLVPAKLFASKIRCTKVVGPARTEGLTIRFGSKSLEMFYIRSDRAGEQKHSTTYELNADQTVVSTPKIEGWGANLTISRRTHTLTDPSGNEFICQEVPFG
ncbi:MAG: hypothetical protein AAFW46_18725 [Pseudomonadota bacterium]